MITLLRVVIGTGCLAIGVTFIGVALRQYRREMTWRRVHAVVERTGDRRNTDLAYLDADGRPHVARHWGVSSTTGTGERVTILHHPRTPGRVAIPFGAPVLSVLTLAGIAVTLLGLWMLSIVLAG
ncbi:DUF3592 domain-containing protein [Elioraea sp.]|uniref:DUF3592 domain-containing protein n=1 Tax=Elioraea sp. TaxID=2185103 RepID=UPI0025BCE2F9|nr:DUF3592 domain-containing protein [Elioraea sp.]